MITSFFDGRIRVRIAALKDTELMGMALAFIRTQPGVLRVTPNHRLGSILIEYDPAQLSREAVAQALLPVAAHLAPEQEHRDGCALLKPRNDSAALLCSLGLTCVALLLRDKRAHALCGILFTAMAALHAAARR